VKWLCLVVLAVACGHSGKPPAKHVDPPPGDGWWCAPAPGLCDREQQTCEDYASKVGAERPCTAVSTASCFASGSGAYSCTGEPGACRTLQEFAAHRGEQIAQACAEVR
jgi:hypothetical protein